MKVGTEFIPFGNLEFGLAKAGDLRSCLRIDTESCGAIGNSLHLRAAWRTKTGQAHTRIRDLGFFGREIDPSLGAFVKNRPCHVALHIYPNRAEMGAAESLRSGLAIRNQSDVSG